MKDNFYHFINEITKDTKNHGESAKKLGSTFFASIRRTLGATNPLFSIVYGFLMNCKSRFARKLPQHLLQICRSALRWYISLSRTTGLSTDYRSGQISQWIFWHRYIVYLSMSHLLFWSHFDLFFIPSSLLLKQIIAERNMKSLPNCIDSVLFCISMELLWISYIPFITEVSFYLRS